MIYFLEGLGKLEIGWHIESNNFSLKLCGVVFERLDKLVKNAQIGRREMRNFFDGSPIKYTLFFLQIGIKGIVVQASYQEKTKLTVVSAGSRSRVERRG